MKKYLFIIIVVLEMFASTLPVVAQHTFYIYRNDGIINTFFSAEVDSMTYSKIDLDSLLHETPVVQEVYTPDSIYRIPIELIDSIGFVTPETVYQRGVKVIEGEMRGYVISASQLSLFFDISTPNRVLPKIGDKLVTTEVDDIIRSAFVGEVEEIKSTPSAIEVICKPVDLTDIFECYYGVIKKENQPSYAKTRGISDGYYSTNGTRTLSPGKLSIDLLNTHEISVSYQAEDDLSFSVDHAQATISLTPKVDYSAYLIINKEYGTNVSITAIANYSMEEYFALAGGLSIGDDAPLFEKAIPIPEALIDVFFEFGIFANFKATISTEQTWTQNYKHVFHWEWSSKGQETIKNVNEFKPVSSSHTGKIALNGGLSVGAYGKVGIAFIATSSLDIAEVDLRAEGGISIEGTYVPYKRDEEYAKKSTDLYNQIKDREVGVYWFYGLAAEAKLFKWSINKQIPDLGNIPLNKKGMILGFRLVPLFKDTKLEKKHDGTYFGSKSIYGGDVFKTDVGFALINKNDENDATYSYCVYDYNGPNAESYASFYDKPLENKYKLYPLVKYLGMELIAEPSAEADEVAGITFKSAEILDVNAEPKYNGDEEYLFTWYTTKFKYVIQIVGSDSIDYVQPVIYDNGTWNYNGGKTRVPGDGLFAVTTNMSYDSEANMNWSTGYEITLKNGEVIYSTNNLQIGGTPANPTINVTEPATLSKQSNIRSKSSTFSKQLYPVIEELEFVRIE